jgi:hypothetical protein
METSDPGATGEAIGSDEADTVGPGGGTGVRDGEGHRAGSEGQGQPDDDRPDGAPTTAARILLHPMLGRSPRAADLGLRSSSRRLVREGIGKTEVFAHPTTRRRRNAGGKRRVRGN